MNQAKKRLLEKCFAQLTAVNLRQLLMSMPGTELDEPVVQTTDNETYLNKTFDGGNGDHTWGQSSRIWIIRRTSVIV